MEQLEKQQILNAYILANKEEFKQKLILQGWNPNYINIPFFQQDIYGSKYTDVETNEEVFIPPTFNWHSRITSQKLFNGEFFYCSIIFLNDEFDDIKDKLTIFKILDEDFENALQTMEEYSKCDCKVDVPCEKHRI